MQAFDKFISNFYVYPFRGLITYCLSHLFYVFIIKFKKGIYVHIFVDFPYILKVDDCVFLSYLFKM